MGWGLNIGFVAASMQILNIQFKILNNQWRYYN